MRPHPFRGPRPVGWGRGGWYGRTYTRHEAMTERVWSILSSTATGKTSARGIRGGEFPSECPICDAIWPAPPRKRDCAARGLRRALLRRCLIAWSNPFASFRSVLGGAAGLSGAQSVRKGSLVALVILIRKLFFENLTTRQLVSSTVASPEPFYRVHKLVLACVHPSCRVPCKQFGGSRPAGLDASEGS